MLNTLDIVIGFAVIMTVLSLFITILVQMVSTGLALRGKNLANALSLTFQTIDPKIGEQAHSLAAQILRDPIFSDSIWRTKSREVDVAGLALMDSEKKLAAAKQAFQLESDPAKQAQLTTLVDQLGGAFDAAKANLGKLGELVNAERELKQATKALAKAVDEDMKTVALRAIEAGKAKVAAARAAAKLPEVKLNRQKPWKFWTLPWGGARQLGNAIRPGEVYRVLHELAEHTETEAVLKGIPAGLATTAGAIIQALTKEDRPTTEARQKLSLLNWVGDTYFKAMPAQQAALVNSLPDLAATVERATTQAYDRFQRWFGSGQDRAEQWFQTHMRGVTIVMAVLTAFLLQLDTVDIYRQLREQPALTAALVKAAPGVVEQGTTVLDPANTAAYHTYLLWLQKHPLFPLKTLPEKGTDAAYRNAIADRIKAAPDLEYPVQQFDKAFELAKNAEGFADAEGTAAKTAYTAWMKNFPMFTLDAEPDDAATQQSVHDAIQAKVTADADAKAAPDQDKMKEWLAEYDSLQSAGKFAYESARQNAYRDLKKQMDAAGFALAPVPFLSRWDSEPLPVWARGIYPPAAHYLVHFIGVLMTAGLLTLGAPFWFNLLKNLTSLRPALASLIEKRPTSSPALPQAPATPGTS